MTHPLIDPQTPLSHLSDLINQINASFAVEVISTREEERGAFAELRTVAFNAASGEVLDLYESEVCLVPRRHLGTARVAAYLEAWARALPMLMTRTIAENNGNAPLAMYVICPALLEDSSLRTIRDFELAFNSVAEDAPHPLFTEYLSSLSSDEPD